VAPTECPYYAHESAFHKQNLPLPVAFSSRLDGTLTPTKLGKGYMRPPVKYDPFLMVVMAVMKMHFQLIITKNQNDG